MLPLNRVQIRGVPQAVDLIVHGLADLWVGMTHAADRDTAKRIEISGALCAGQPNALTTLKAQWLAIENRYQVA